MNKLLNKPFFLKLFALLLTGLLFFQTNNPYLLSNKEYVTSSKKKADILDVPLEILYDQTNYIISDNPETISVSITGPKSLVISAENSRNFRATATLDDPIIGKNLAKVKIKGLSDKLKVIPNPAQVTINVQERIEKDFSITPDLGAVSLEEGYNISEVSISPREVHIVGGKDNINKIDKVLAVVTTQTKINKTFKINTDLIAVDKNKEQLNVILEPKVAQVSVNVQAPTKEVPLVVQQQGSLPDSLILDSITLNHKNITLSGKKKELNKVNEIPVKIDLSKITEDTEKTLTIEVPNQLVSDLSKVIATIKINKKTAKTIQDIEALPLDNNLRQKISYPNGNIFSLEVFSNVENEAFRNLSASDFNIYFDTSDLEAGTHTLPLKVNAPEGINYKLSGNEITIIIEE